MHLIYWLLVSVLLAVLTACGDGTIGPLTTSGLASRSMLRAEVDWLRQHGSADTRPLDALIDMQTYYERVDSTDVMFYRIDVQVIDERGVMSAPSVSMNGDWMSPTGNGYVRLLKQITDTNLVFTIIWPDTAVTLPVSILSATTLGADTLTYKTTWSQRARSPIVCKGLASDSIVTATTFIEGLGLWSSTIWDTQADRGTFTLPSRVADSAQVGDNILVQQYRSYYRVVRLSTPTSGYGNRHVGILQRHRIPYLITVVP